MKITKSQLKQIIKEEVASVLSEETRAQGIKRIQKEKEAEIQTYLDGLPDGGEAYKQFIEMDEEFEDYINAKGYDKSDPFVAKFEQLADKTMPIQKEIAKITKKHRQRMKTELPKGEKSYIQQQYDRQGTPGHQRWQGGGKGTAYPRFE